MGRKSEVKGLTANRIPLYDAAHVREAFMRFHMMSFRDEREKLIASVRIVATAERLGVKVPDAFRAVVERSTDAKLLEVFRLCIEHGDTSELMKEIHAELLGREGLHGAIDVISGGGTLDEALDAIPEPES